MKDGLYTFDELSHYMDKAKEPLSELVKASQDREKFWHDELIKSQSKVEEMQKAFEAIHRIASETFESHNQLELIRLTAVEHLKGGETK